MKWKHKYILVIDTDKQEKITDKQEKLNKIVSSFSDFLCNKNAKCLAISKGIEVYKLDKKGHIRQMI